RLVRGWTTVEIGPARVHNLLFRVIEVVNPHAEMIEADLLVALLLQERDVDDTVPHVDAAASFAGALEAESLLEEFCRRLRIRHDDRDVAKPSGHCGAPALSLLPLDAAQ